MLWSDEVDDEAALRPYHAEAVRRLRLRARRLEDLRRQQIARREEQQRIDEQARRREAEAATEQDTAAADDEPQTAAEAAPAAADDDGEDVRLDPLAREILGMMADEGEVDTNADGADATAAEDGSLGGHLEPTQARVIETVHREFAHAAAARLRGGLGLDVDVVCTALRQLRYEQFVTSLMEPTSWRRLRLEPGGGQVVLHVDATIALGCLDRLTGSDGAAGTPPRPLTAIETAVLAPLLDGMTGDLERAWARAGPVRLSSRSISSDLQLAGLAQRQEAVVEVSLQVRARPFSGLVMICYPLTALRPLFDVLTARNPPEAEGRVLAGHSPLPVSAQVGAARLSASQARALAVGDVVLLDARAGDPVTVCVDGEPRLTGLPYVPESGQTIVKLWQQLPQAGGRP